MDDFLIMEDGTVIINRNDALSYLSKKLGCSYPLLSRFFREGVFKNNTPFSLLKDFELASALLNAHFQNIKKKKKIINPNRPTIDVTIQNAGNTYRFRYKKHIVSFLGRRYNVKLATMHARISVTQMFWTTDLIAIVKDLRRADDYHRAFMNDGMMLSPYEKELRIQQGDGNMPAFDGKMYTQPQINESYQEVLKQREAVKTISQILNKTPETIRRYFKRGLFSLDNPKDMALDPERVIADYQAYQDRLQQGRTEHLHKIHEKQRKGELSFHPSDKDMDVSVPTIPKTMTLTNKIHALDRSIARHHATIEKNKNKIIKLKEEIEMYEYNNTEIEQLIIEDENDRSLLLEAKRVMNK